ncbi:MAG: hypothetical protein C7B43_20750 [Sulfobacillus benefaciens]|uniref:SHOCT domain-containing protein n=1 Tax=Sulfobacillus benefaciens TaxID=453960 RepID=A0A2T2WJJ6_9FIRM|nr:MAG: hypothetical protein C7B43_20750 [Sulfobacillus benefaciens]
MTLMDLRHRYLAGDIDTEQYLLQVDAVRRAHQHQMTKRMILASIAVAGGGIASIFSPVMACVFILLVGLAGVIFVTASCLSL